MTQKIYKTARGKVVDLGSLILQNENVRAVGNMNVNARGDILDSTNQVIERKNRQVQKQYKKQTNVSNTPVAASIQEIKRNNISNKDTAADVSTFVETDIENVAPEIPDNIDEFDTDKQNTEETPVKGGLAAAIARSRTIKQELEKSPTSTVKTINKI